MKVVILTFSFNDWLSAAVLLERLDGALADANREADMVLVDDASTEPRPEGFGKGPYRALGSIEIVRIAQNLGHQRAIAVGLCHAYTERAFDSVLVMDADGEDLPADAIRLLEAAESSGNAQAVFAARSRRSEGLLFRLFYQLYRITHYLLTGRGIRVGNFSILPKRLLAGLVVDPNLWNHYAASVFNSRLPRTTIPAARGQRFQGKSKLNFTALVMHGLSAIACYGEIVGVRVLVGSMIVSALVILGIIIIAIIRFTTDLAVPGWATTAVGFLLVILLQILGSAALFTFSILNHRKGSAIIPVRDYRFWIESVS